MNQDLNKIPRSQIDTKVSTRNQDLIWKPKSQLDTKILIETKISSSKKPRSQLDTKILSTKNQDLI